MKTLTTLLTTSLFAASAYAGDIYHGFADGSPDLYAWQPSTSVEMTGVQPGVGDTLGGYRTESNLFRSGAADTKASRSWDIYNGFESSELAPNR